MRKSTKILLGIFCVGILLTGVGVGVGCLEFSSLEYAGDYSMVEEASTEKTFELVVDPTEQEAIFLGNFPGEFAEITYSSDIPENTIRWTVTYNENICIPGLQVESYRFDGRTRKKASVIWESSREDSDLALFMKMKDQILADLKQHKIGSYGVSDYTGISIVVSESLAGCVEEGNDIYFPDTETCPNDNQDEDIQEVTPPSEGSPAFDE